MKNSKYTYTEIQFTATDLDSTDSVTDIIALCLEPAEIRDKEDYIEKTIEGYFDKHPIIGLTGNTWKVDGFRKTGRVYTKEVIYTEVTPREKDFEKEYPLCIMG